MPTVKFSEKDVYGRPLLYPACGYAFAFCKILGVKSMPAIHLDEIRQLGFDVQISGTNMRFLEALPLALPA